MCLDSKRTKDSSVTHKHGLLSPHEYNRFFLLLLLSSTQSIFDVGVYIYIYIYSYIPLSYIYIYNIYNIYICVCVEEHITWNTTIPC